MGDMLLRGVPDALKTELVRFAKEDGTSLSEKTIQILRKGLVVEKTDRSQPKENAWEMLRSAFEEADATDGEFSKIMDEIEAERKKDFGKQPLDFE